MSAVMNPTTSTNPSTEFLGDKESQQQLESMIVNDHDRKRYTQFGHQRFESAFDGRLFVVYSPQGMHENCTHRNPEIHSTLKVLGYTCDSRSGAEVQLIDLATGGQQRITHVPARVFDYEIFMSVPPFMRLRWDAKPQPDGTFRRTLSYALLVKCANRSDFYSMHNTYCETPNKFRTLFPGIELQLRYT